MPAALIHEKTEQRLAFNPFCLAEIPTWSLIFSTLYAIRKGPCAWIRKANLAVRLLLRSEDPLPTSSRFVAQPFEATGSVARRRPGSDS